MRRASSTSAAEWLAGGVVRDMRAVPDDARYVGARDQGVAHGANSAMVTTRADILRMQLVRAESQREPATDAAHKGAPI